MPKERQRSKRNDPHIQVFSLRRGNQQRHRLRPVSLARQRRFGIEPKIVELVDTADGAAIAQSLNILRTHYTPGQRAMFAVKMANLKVGKPKSQRNQDDSEISNFGQLIRGMSQPEAAAATGVSRSLVADAVALRTKASPEIVSAVEYGALSVNAGLKIAGLPTEKQAPALKEWTDRKLSKDGRRRPDQKGTFKSSPKRPIEGRMDRCLDQLETVVEVLGPFFDEAVTHENYARWVIGEFRKQKANPGSLDPEYRTMMYEVVRPTH